MLRQPIRGSASSCERSQLDALPFLGFRRVQTIRSDETKEESYMTCQMSMRASYEEGRIEGYARGCIEERIANIQALKGCLSPEKIAEIFEMPVGKVKEVLHS